MTRPHIFQFDNPACYLRSELEFAQNADPKFTVRRWALRMGLRSPKPLFALLQGTRQFKLKDLEFIRKGLDLSPIEVRFFEALILWQKAPSAEKDFWGNLIEFLKQQQTVSTEKLDGTKGSEPSTFETDDEDLFSHWTDAALLSALRLKAVRRNLNLIRKNLLWEKDPSQIDRSMNKIRKHQLISSGREESSKPRYEKITTSNDKPHRGGRAYYAQVNQIATQAVALPYEVREFQCFSIPAHTSDAPEFKRLLRKFREDLAILSSEDGNTVFQFNLEMFPLLTPIGAEEADHYSLPLT